ncbi:hypothetical protein B1H18_09555 [Streptomyces tsukubensis]|uniref:non-specific serine/threonine protein kinase n=1 Tax=Streptomyces tsukubensis TaxID=83656 RepID=A0A1V4ABD8_9ACTN|nr:hypothetical protein B1H18_09555 [Streptomyces tsukubensis]
MGGTDEAAGRVVAGRYRLRKRLGAGGMGRVWLAHDEKLGADVAVKEIAVPPGVAEDSLSNKVARAISEAKNAALLRGHPHVVTVYDVFELDGLPWIVMAYVPGAVDLDVMVRASGTLSSAQVARVGRAVLGALSEGHAADVLHRDVKPANLLLAPDPSGDPFGRVLLTDYGISLRPGSGDPRLTAAADLIGTPGYMAPERARGAAPSPAADLFSLGATLYFAAEGVGPFAREGEINTFSALLLDPPPPMTRVSPLLAHAVLGLLAKTPEQRTGAEETDARLAAVLDEEGTRAAGAPPFGRPGRPARTVSLRKRKQDMFGADVPVPGDHAPEWTSARAPGTPGPDADTGPSPVTGSHPATGSHPETGPYRATALGFDTAARPAAASPPAAAPGPTATPGPSAAPGPAAVPHPATPGTGSSATGHPGTPGDPPPDRATPPTSAMPPDRATPPISATPPVRACAGPATPASATPVGPFASPGSSIAGRPVPAAPSGVDVTSTLGGKRGSEAGRRPGSSSSGRRRWRPSRPVTAIVALTLLVAGVALWGAHQLTGDGGRNEAGRSSGSGSGTGRSEGRTDGSGGGSSGDSGAYPYGENVGLISALKPGQCVQVSWPREKYEGVAALADGGCDDNPDGQVTSEYEVTNASQAAKNGTKRCADRSKALTDKLPGAFSYAVVPTKAAIEAGDGRAAVACVLLVRDLTLGGRAGDYRSMGEEVNIGNTSVGDCVDITKKTTWLLARCAAPHSEQIVGWVRQSATMSDKEFAENISVLCDKRYAAAWVRDQNHMITGWHIDEEPDYPYGLCMLAQSDGGTLPGGKAEPINGR